MSLERFEDRSPLTPWNPAKIIVQTLGFAVGVALLVWCVKLALREENRPYLDRIAAASMRDAALLIGLCVASLIANGLLFVVVIRPLYRVHALSMCATNAVATFLNNFPFKISIVSRFVIHSRRDRLPLSTIFSWLAAAAGVIFAVVIPAMLATMLQPSVGAKWWGIALGSCALCVGVMIYVSRLLAKILQKTSTAGMRVFSLLSRVSEAPKMISDTSAVISGIAMRMIDTFLIAFRFAVAARIAGVETEPGTIVLASSLYFLIGAITPSGAIGVRDGGTMGLLKFLPAAGVIRTEFAVVILTVSVVEFAVQLIAAAVGALYLRFSASRPAVAASPASIH